jgi:hypothetical protein
LGRRTESDDRAAKHSTGSLSRRSEIEYCDNRLEDRASAADVGEITLLSPGDILFLYTDGVYDGSDVQDRGNLEAVMREHCVLSAKDICNALLEFAVSKDGYLLRTGEEDKIDDKTVSIIKKD